MVSVFKGQLPLTRSVYEAPRCREKIVTVLKPAVVEIVDSAPVVVASVFQQGLGEGSVAIARRDHDPKCLAVHIMLLPGQVPVVIAIEVTTDDQF